MIDTARVTVAIGRATLLDQVSARAEAGEVLAIIGPNGAGKSTLLRVLAGELPPRTGQVQMGGRPLDEWSSGERARVRAVLPQSSSLEFPFTALEVALIGRLPHQAGRETARDRRIAMAALDAAGVADLRDRIYPTLSGGERQRVQLARALAQIWEPPADGCRYLLLDEPTAALDLAHQHEVLGRARKLARDRTAVILVMHDLNLAAQYADRLLLLRSGRVLAAGRPGEVLTSATIARA